MEILEEHRCFGGRQVRARHPSTSCHCDMTFSLFLPQQAKHGKVPVLYWLSGLTCTDENFSNKAGAQRVAAELGLALVMPDTSPRGDEVPGDPDSAWDFGHGAGFYVNATQAPWERHYHMYDYVVEELPKLVESEFSLDGERRAIAGHSMGGHGALVAGLRNPDRYRSISAFAPIVNPIDVPWGRKALAGYLGEDEADWPAWDASRLLATVEDPPPIHIDQGEADPFFPEQLQPEALQAAVGRADLTLRLLPGYDHSYFFIASFIEHHLRFHWQFVGR